MPMMVEMRVLDAVGDEDRVLLPMNLGPGVQASGIEDDAIARFGGHPFGRRADEVQSAEAGQDVGRGARPASDLSMPYRRGLVRPMAAFDEPELELAVLETLQVDAHARDSVRVS